MYKLGIYDLFLVNLGAHGKEHTKFFNYIATDFVISAAYFWTETPEGDAFWRDVNRLYREFICHHLTMNEIVIEFKQKTLIKSLTTIQ